MKRAEEIQSLLRHGTLSLSKRLNVTPSACDRGSFGARTARFRPGKIANALKSAAVFPHAVPLFFFREDLAGLGEGLAFQAQVDGLLEGFRGPGILEFGLGKAEIVQDHGVVRS